MEFNSSPESTVGVEVEYGIVSRHSGELVPAASEILEELNEQYPQDGGHPKAKNELFQPSMEVITGICQNPAEAKADLATTLAELKPLLDKRGLGLESTGTHPFSSWNDLPVTPNPRYLRLIERVQWPAHRLLIHGVHVHVGVKSAEKAIITTNVLANYLPIILALSSSSPYWLGRDTGLASARTKVFEGLPTTGIAPQFPDWDAYNTLLDAFTNAGTIQTVREIWWDIRPHPDFGTVELRMCDGIPTLADTGAVAAIAQGLVMMIDDQINSGEAPKPLPDWVLRENKWRACRWGLDAWLIVNEHGQTRELRELFDEMIEAVTPYCQQVESIPELDHARWIVANGASYQRQRAMVAAGATFPELVAELVAETDRSIEESLPIAGATS